MDHSNTQIEFTNLICKDADKKIRLICEDKAIKLYDVNLPFFVKERLEAELQFIEESGSSYRYIPLKIVADKVYSTGGFIENKGYDGTSFVSYLCVPVFQGFILETRLDSLIPLIKKDF